MLEWTIANTISWAYVERELENAILDSILDKNIHARQEKCNRVHEAAYSSCGADSSTKKQYVNSSIDKLKGEVICIVK